MLERDDFTLFDEDDFYNIIGEHLTDKLQDRGIDNYATYFITYASVLIQSHIREYTGLNLYKDYYDDNPNNYDLYLGLFKQHTTGAYIYGDITSEDWLSLEPEDDVTRTPLKPLKSVIYKVLSEGDYKDKLYRYDGVKWIEVKRRGISYRIDLTEDQINFLKLACVYQADYIIDNGSTERMTSMGLINRSNKYNKYDMHEFEICSVSHNLLANAGLLYQGIGGGVYAKLK